jgi:hypothetical protein
MLEMGFMLLSLGGRACQQIHQGIAGMITFHCFPDPMPNAVERLKQLCEKCKYVGRAATWFGIRVSTLGHLQFGMMYSQPKAHSSVMDKLTKGVQKPVRRTAAMTALDMRSCGSGRKY